MTIRPSALKKTLLAATVCLLAIGLGTALFAMKPAESEVLPAAARAAPAAAPAPAAEATVAAAPAPAAPKPRSKEQAAAALMALPELKAWSALVEKNSGGKAHGALIEYDTAMRQVKGKRYWQFSFVENSEEAALRWESFLASDSDNEILVDDAETDELLSLDRWRKERQPAKRSGVGG